MGLPLVLRLVTVEPIVFLYMWSSFQQFPTNQALIYTKVCTLKYDNVTICDNLYSKKYKTEDDYVQSEASKWIMYNNIASTVPSVLSVTFFLGPFGDVGNRKIPLIIPIIGCILFNAGNLINAFFKYAPMWCLLFGNLVNGFTGGYIAVMMAAYSYIGHISTMENRTLRVAIVEAMIFFAGTLGVFVSGTILDNTSFYFVYSFIITLLLLALVYCVFRLDSLRTHDTNTPFCRRFLATSIAMLNCVRRGRANRGKTYIALFILVLVILQLCTTGKRL